MTWIKEWLRSILSQDRRDAQRHPSPRLLAYYWDETKATVHSLRDISLSGFFLLTEDRWYPGTVVLIQLQRTDDSRYAGSARSIAVQSKVIRFGADGVGFRVVAPEAAGSRIANVADVAAFGEYVWRLVGGQRKLRVGAAREL